MESGKVIQPPSTHLLGTNFSKPFNVKFTDKDGEEKLGFITCYGTAISRIYGAMVAILGDDRGLILPGFGAFAGCNCSNIVQGFKEKSS